MATKQSEENELRFLVANDETIEELKRSSENKNTRKGTENWMNVVRKWAAKRENVNENNEVHIFLIHFFQFND